MSLAVLQSRIDIAKSRSALVDQGLSSLTSRPAVWMRRLGFSKEIVIGDFVKSWDVEAAISTLRTNTPKEAAVADIGCFSSEILVALHKAGYTDLTGIDLNPSLGKMPHADEIKYIVSDFTNCPLPDSSLSAITAISVIEHGYEPHKLFAEISRLLKPGGHFIASFDYWPDKIDTGDLEFFGMSWLIFGKDDVLHLLSVAAEYGLEPIGELRFGASTRPIHCAGMDYTFALLVLTKSR